LGITLPRDATIRQLGDAAHAKAVTCRQELESLLRRHRAERSKRFTAALPHLWKEDLGVIQRWLQSPDVPWVSGPVLDAMGQQCLTPVAVDSAVRGYWVDQVFCQHAEVDEEACWQAFLDSPFACHTPMAT
jgi:hypothetical protein